MNVFSDRDLAFGNYWQVSPLQDCKKKKKKILAGAEVGRWKILQIILDTVPLFPRQQQGGHG